MSIVEVKKVSKTYHQGKLSVVALDAVDLTIEKGAFIALAGPSGSGKTTLLNIIGGLDRPTSGEVVVAGEKLGELSREKLALLRRDRIGFIFQSYNLIPVLTAMENAEFVLLLQSVPLATRQQLVKAVLDEVGLQGMEGRFPNELSGGQQQRVAIARAIVSQPAIILADEPTANLDSKTAQALLQTMRQMNETKGSTFIFSTHDPQVMEAAKQVVYLRDGKIEKTDSA